MFNWLGNIFPYSDLHSLNLDWILTKMKETAAQAAQAIADSAKALAQVAEAKAAALSAQTAAQNAQTAANNAQTAADNAATSAENAVTVAQQAKSAAQTAQNTANTAQTAAENAQNTANSAQTAAQNAQNTANEAKTGLSDLNAKFPIKTDDISNRAVTTEKIATNAITASEISAGAITETKIANSAVTGNKLSDNVIFGFQYDDDVAYVPINSTSTPVTLRAPSFPGRRAAYLNFSTTVSGYSFIPAITFLSVDFRESISYTSTLEIMNDSTMEVTKYIVKYKNNTLTLYTPGTVEPQNIVIPLKANVSTYKSVKTT